VGWGSSLKLFQSWQLQPLVPAASSNIQIYVRRSLCLNCGGNPKPEPTAFGKLRSVICKHVFSVFGHENLDICHSLIYCNFRNLSSPAVLAWLELPTEFRQCSSPRAFIDMASPSPDAGLSIASVFVASPSNQYLPFNIIPGLRSALASLHSSRCTSVASAFIFSQPLAHGQVRTHHQAAASQANLPSLADKRGSQSTISTVQLTIQWSRANRLLERRGRWATACCYLRAEGPGLNPSSAGGHLTLEAIGA